jgi:hypothetical protein
MRKIIGIILSCFLLLVAPCIDAVEFKQYNDNINSKLDNINSLFDRDNMLVKPAQMIGLFFITYIVLFIFQVFIIWRFMFVTFIDALILTLKHPLSPLIVVPYFILELIKIIIEIIKPCVLSGKLKCSFSLSKIWH